MVVNSTYTTRYLTLQVIFFFYIYTIYGKRRVHIYTIKHVYFTAYIRYILLIILNDNGCWYSYLCMEMNIIRETLLGLYGLSLFDY